MIQRWCHSLFSALSDYIMSSRLSLLAHVLGVAGGRTYTHDAGKGKETAGGGRTCYASLFLSVHILANDPAGGDPPARERAHAMEQYQELR